jgi:enoyl-CoA hydratase/carnithine racemase
MSEFVIYEQAGHIVTLTLNMPESRNPISGKEMIDALENALQRIDDDDSVRVAILTGAGKAFSSGGDLRLMAKKGGVNDMSAYGVRKDYLRGIQRIPRAMERLQVPIIAAVNGPAVGAGNDLVCMCDIRIAARSARFLESFVKVGIIPGDGGAYFLPRAVGASMAAEMMFTGDALDAEQALACGLVSRVVDDAELMNEARALAARIAANPGYTLRLAKRLLREGRHASLDTILEMSASMQALAHGQPDHKEAVAAFLEKRPPVFSEKS